MTDDEIVRRAADHLGHAIAYLADEQRESSPELKRVRAENLSEVVVHGMKVEQVEIECDLCDHVAVESGRTVGRRLRSQVRQSVRIGRGSGPSCCALRARSRGKQRTTAICTSVATVVYVNGSTILLSLPATLS
jgi:hypothetical protein